MSAFHGMLSSLQIMTIYSKMKKMNSTINVHFPAAKKRRCPTAKVVVNITVGFAISSTTGLLNSVPLINALLVVALTRTLARQITVKLIPALYAIAQLI